MFIWGYFLLICYFVDWELMDPKLDPVDYFDK